MTVLLTVRVMFASLALRLARPCSFRSVAKTKAGHCPALPLIASIMSMFTRHNKLKEAPSPVIMPSRRVMLFYVYSTVFLKNPVILVAPANGRTDM